jgi:RNA-splicing ligase RtcB
MIELNGKYSTAKIFTDVIDEESISQIIALCNQKFTENQRIRIMPDVHAGSGCTVGTSMTVTDKTVPAMVGVDIGCGMETIKIKEKHIELQKLDKLIYDKIPSGFAIREKPHRYIEKTSLELLKCFEHINSLRAEKSLGTLGGGNHFIEADKSEDGSYYIVVHSGSRHLGVEVAKYYQNEAYKRLNSVPQHEINKLIAKLKANGMEKNIQKELKKLENIKKTPVQKNFAYTEGDLFDQYIHDMKIIQQFALINRQAIIDEIVKGMKFHVIEQFSTIHNYIDTENMILRKGAVSAQLGEKLIIPINMRDGSLICRGKGNPDWNFSAPHGAGRLFSRSMAKQTFTVSQFKKEMTGIYTTSINQHTLDECPMAYKRIEDIADNIGDTAEITEIIRPVYNFKAGTE